MIDIEDFKKSIGKKSRLLGIDPGKKRVGIAISDENKLVSTPLKTILKNQMIPFSTLINQFKTELLWNSLVYALFNDRLNVNKKEI